MTERSRFKKRNIKISQSREKTMREYIVEFYAARYLWNLGYRSIGFDVEIMPYGRFDVVATKSLFQKKIAIVDCIDSSKEFFIKTHNPMSLQEKKEELTSLILQETNKLAVMEKNTGIKIDITQDKAWCNLANSLRSVYEDIKSGGLYWHMTNTYPIATEHWCFCYQSLYKKIDPNRLNGWGLVVLKNGLFEMHGKTLSKNKPEQVEPRVPIEKHIDNINGRIAHSLTESVIGSKELKSRDFKDLFALVEKMSEVKDRGIATALIKENGG